MKKIQVLATDPGLKNFAWCLMDAGYNNKLGTFGVKVGRSGILPNLEDLISEKTVEATAKIHSMLTELASGVDFICSERFMTRGTLTGKTGEAVNMVLGVLSKMGSELCVDVGLITPAQWKTAFNRSAKPYGGGLNQLYKICKTTPHQLDAALIGVYYASMKLRPDCDNHFDMIAGRRSRDKFLDELEAQSEVALINRRMQR